MEGEGSEGARGRRELTRPRSVLAYLAGLRRQGDGGRVSRKGLYYVRLAGFPRSAVITHATLTVLVWHAFSAAVADLFCWWFGRSRTQRVAAPSALLGLLSC